MKDNQTIKNLGEIGLIDLIDELIHEKTSKKLLRDDSFFYDLDEDLRSGSLVMNSDMFVSTTDAPKRMSYYQMGRKAVLMNISDLIVKGVAPAGMIISLGIPEGLKIKEFKEIIEGIIEYGKNWNIDYIGGDLNHTKEIIINPTVFGFINPAKLLRRKGMEVGDILVANGKFGLTGVGFDILLKNNTTESDFEIYRRSIDSGLEPKDPGKEAFILSKFDLASSSIDSSDGLAKSLSDLLISNPKRGFEIHLSEEFIDKEALQYVNKYKVSLEDLVFYGGEEFIQIFTIRPQEFDKALIHLKKEGGTIFKLGKVISEEKIYIIKNSVKSELKSKGYQHFS